MARSQVTRMSLGTAALAAVLSLATGCVTTGEHAPSKPVDSGRLVTRWEHEVAFAADPTRNGAPTPGIVGRVYVLGATGQPVYSDGSLHVELLDASQEPAKLLETWDFPPAEAQKIKKDDAFGPGYSLFLPWSSYQKDRTQIQMRVAFQSGKGVAPLYANSGRLQLGGSRPMVSSSTYTTGPTGQAPQRGQPMLNMAGQTPQRAMFGQR